MNQQETKKKRTKIVESDFLIGDKRPNIGKQHLTSTRKRNFYNDLMNDENEIFPDLGYTTVESMIDKKEIRKVPKKSEKKVPSQVKMPNFIQIQNSVNFFNKVDGYLRDYDINKKNRIQLASQEYNERNILPLQQKLKEELNGEKYSDRRRKMQPNIHHPPMNIESISIKMHSKGDRTTQHIKQKREEDQMEGRLREIDSNIQQNEKRKKIKNERVTCDFEAEKISKEIRFFDGGKLPNKGQKIFTTTYCSQINQCIRNYNDNEKNY
ncbi:hypothetical protein TRFO_36823 [Tritrichomonas foetus]|uniref:Uncharacterized protein n=1 Tax=Tritrichomonas foetus TaxID=1144522 RepID=A0A1J4JED8_9EUKA|nr:hypothetical protein TRFO_36823 [Tritrichomonas foetus]|eukprot:OHS97017.1 hypothetical protein TRFO_36823 [Tritrichomonas foetus]